MSPRSIDYDTYYGKHCARFYGWLPAAKDHKSKIQKSPKYFTLCGAQAIDVFMFEHERVLTRDKNNKLPNVIVCEDMEDAWIEILRVVRPPVDEAVILGKLQDILTFEDDEDTRDRSPDEDEPDFRIRQKLIIKGKFEQVKKHFPFDIINFDPCEGLVDSDLEANKLYQAFKRIFELQKSTNGFLLFVNSDITDIHSNVQSRFRSDFESNVSKYPNIRDTLLSDGITTYDKIDDENKRKAVGFAKSIVMSAARSEGWNCEHQGVYIYEYEPGGTKMLSLVVKLSKTQNKPDEATYVQDVIRIIKSMPNYYPYQEYNEVSAEDKVKEHLEKVKKYREQVRKEYAQE
jgi:hypothetical protein